jgi:cytoskeletal protein RodZ
MSLGQFMQGARESAGLSIDELASRISIRAGLLREIEDNNFIHCGGDTYARGHLRNIAAHISVDPQRRALQRIAKDSRYVGRK